MEERINKVFGADIVDNENIEYTYDNKIFFKAKSKGKSIVPVIVEIKH